MIFVCLFLWWCAGLLCWGVELPLAMYVKFALCSLCFRASSQCCLALSNDFCCMRFQIYAH